jgi:hypothetical protein
MAHRLVNAPIGDRTVHFLVWATSTAETQLSPSVSARRTGASRGRSQPRHDRLSMEDGLRKGDKIKVLAGSKIANHRSGGCGGWNGAV